MKHKEEADSALLPDSATKLRSQLPRRGHAGGIHCRTIVEAMCHLTVTSQVAQSLQPCVNSHQLSQWEPVIFDHPQNRSLLTDS